MESTERIIIGVMNNFNFFVEIFQFSGENFQGFHLTFPKQAGNNDFRKLYNENSAAPGPTGRHAKPHLPKPGIRHEVAVRGIETRSAWRR